MTKNPDLLFVIKKKNWGTYYKSKVEKIWNHGNIHKTMEVVSRGNDTQLHVGENLIFLTW